MKKSTIATLMKMCIAGLLVVAPQGVNATEPIRIAYSTWVGFGPIYLAQAKGFYKAQGVDVEIQVIDDVKIGMAALAAKRLDAYGISPNSLLLYVKPDQRFIMVVTVNDSRGGDGVVARKEIKSIRELKGKRVAFMEGSVAEFYLDYLLKREGLSQKDIVPLNMTTGDAGAAFVAGRVDAAVVWEPWLSKGKTASQGHMLIDSGETPGIIVDTLAFRADVAKKRGGDVRKVVQAIFQAVDYWKTSPKEAAATMASGLGGWLKDPKQFEEALRGVILFDRDQNRQFMGTKQTPGPLYQTVRNAIEFWRGSGKLVWTEVTPEDVIDPSFLD